MSVQYRCNADSVPLKTLDNSSVMSLTIIFAT